MEQFVSKLRLYQDEQQVCIGQVEVSLPRASTTVSSSGELPLNLKLLARLADECSLDWHVKLNSTPGDSIFVVRPMAEETAVTQDRSEPIPSKDVLYNPAVANVLRVLRIPHNPPRGFEIDVRESENGAWIGISNRADSQVLLTREMLDSAIRHAATLQVQLKRSTVQLEILTESSRKRTRTEDDVIASPAAKRRAMIAA